MLKNYYIMLFLLSVIVGKATAQTYTLGTELTWDQVKDGTTAFALVSGSQVLYGTTNQNLSFGGTSSALSESNSVVRWKVESATGSNVYFRGYNLAGNAHTAYGSPAYLNSQPSIGSVTFVLNNQNTTEGYTGGQDMNNGAVWTVTAVSGGYTIKNVGNNGYLAGATTSATADKVWKFYSIKESSRADFVFTGYDANDGYTLRPIRQYEKDIVYADDVNKKVTLHGVMDTPNRYFNDDRWEFSSWETRYTTDADVTNCLAYFEKTLSAYTNHQAGSYCDVFRLHLDPAWTNTPGESTAGEHDISAFSADRLRTYMTKLYWPIAKKAIDKGMYVIMRPPGVCPPTIKVGDAYYNYLMTVWDIVSKDENVKNYAGMIMLELANEPQTVLDTDGTNSNNRASVLHDFFQPIVDKIRENGFKGIILSSGSGYQSQYDGYATKPITGDNIGYAVHWYPGWMGTNMTKDVISDQTIINQFHTQVPVVDSRPIVVTEVDWSPELEPKEIKDTNEHGQVRYKNYGTWATGYSSSFGKNFKATHDHFGNISMTLTHPYEYVDFEQLFGNDKITYSYQNKSNMPEPREACAYTCFVDWYPKLYTNHWIPGKEPSDIPTKGDLTASMFHEWDGVGAEANIVNKTTGCAYELNVSTGLPYGDGSVICTHYADLSQYGTLEVTTSAGEPRFCFNRIVNEGDVPLEFPRDKATKPYETVKDNSDGTTTYTIDLQAIVNEAGFAHLNCIKGANYANVTVTSMRVLPVETITTPIDLAFTEEGSKTFGPLHFQVEGDGVSINPLTGEVTATKAGGKIFVLFNNADLSAAKSITLDVNTTSPYADICDTGEIFNEGTSINAWYGSKYNMQNLDKEASINQVAQGYNWNEKMGSVTKLQWNINAAGTMKINGVTITSGVPGSSEPEDDPEEVEENYTASTYGRRPIDNKHPMWIVHVDVWNQADPQKIIDLIPEDIKPYVVMNLSLSCSYDKDNDIYQRGQNAVSTYKSWGSICQQNGMWFTCQPASGGHTHIMDDDLETFEYFFKAYPNFLGWNYAEQFWGFNEAGDKSSTTEETRIELFAKLIPMHHQYGGFLTISFCGMASSHALNPQGMLKRNAALLKASEDYPDAILWLYKYTHPKDFYNNESVTFGPFVAGLAKNYGVRYDNCGYNDALHSIFPRSEYPDFWRQNSSNEYEIDNTKLKYPTAAGIGTVMEQMAQNGGAVWDGPELIWTEDFQNLNNSNVDGYTQRNWGTFPGFSNIWVDMFRKVIDGTIYIPTQKEVQAKTKIAIINDVTSGSNEDKYATWADLYDNIYKVDDPLNTTKVSSDFGVGQFDNNLSYQKSSGRYGTIPMMPELYTADAKAIPTKVKKSERTTVWADLAAKKAAFDAAYPEVSTGDLFVSRYKNQLVTYNPYSNLGKTATNDRSASANIPLQYNTCTSMDLTYANYSSGMVKEHRDHIDFYLNNFRTDTTTTVVDKIVINGATAKPSYTMTKRVDAEATATETWSGNVYTLEINHMGPVDLTINCAGAGTGRSSKIVSDKALSEYNMPKQPEKFVGKLVKEAEDMNYKNIEGCLDNYYYQDKTIRGHAGNGIVKMGTNAAGGLTTNIKANSTESYNVTVRYCNTDKAGNIRLTVGGSTKQLALEKTVKNEWKKATIAFDFTEGNNTFKLDNTNGLGIWVDNVEFTPANIAAEEYAIVIKSATGGTVASDKTKATEGTKVTLTVTPANGYALNGWIMGKAKVNITKNNDGTYSFTMPDDVVTLTPIFKDVTIVYQMDIASTVNSGIPEGWRTTDGSEVHDYPNGYDSGARIFTTFTGTHTHALYWRNLNSAGCSADYGKQDDYTLNLNTGTYKLSYQVAAWKGTPQYKAQILKEDGIVLQTTDNITATPNANGANTADLSATEEKSFEFTVTEQGKYVINFAATGGEFLLIGCRINAISDGAGLVEPEPEPEPEIAEISDLTKDMFYEWTEADNTGEQVKKADCTYKIDEAAGGIYGDVNNVDYLHYADLSQYQTLSITLASGSAAPRILMNRDINNGAAPDHLINIPENAAQKALYITEVENVDGSITYNVDLAKIVADKGYAHLHAIKSYNSITATSMKLINKGYEEFDFDDFIADGGATFNHNEVSLTSGTGGWNFSTPKDVSTYKYLVITSAQNRNYCTTSTEVSISDGTKTLSGEGGNGYTANGAKFWLDRWNHNNILVIDIDKLEKGGFNTRNLASVKFKIDNTDKLYLSNVYVTNTLPTDDGDFKNNIKVANKFGTICLPYPAAYSGANVYEITGKDSGSKGNIYMKRVNGLMEAGKAYFYYSTENYPEYQQQADYNVYFYKASGIEVTKPVSSNGLVGTFERITAPQRDDKSTFVLSSNKLYYVNSTVAVGANKAYIDFNKIPSSTSAKAFSIQFFGFQEETEVETADATTPTAPVAIYNIAGTRLDRLQKGVNIIRFSDNTTKTVIVK